MQIDIVSDVICPWCFIGKRRLERALAQRPQMAVEVTWRPFQLNPDMPADGMPRQEYRRAKFGSSERSRQLDAQVTEAARAAGLEIHLDRIERTPNTLDAHRLIRWAGERGAQSAVVDRLFTAYFVEGSDVGDREVLADIAAAAGLDRTDAAKYLASNAGVAEVRAEDEGVRQAGLTGVPTFALGRHVLFSGALPPDVFAEALGKAHAALSGRAA
jgi:predicted DsbA family dithiol-disulfide isomerase